MVQFALKTQAIDDDQLVVSLAGSDVTLPCQTQNGNCSWERRVSNVSVVIIHNSEKVSNHSTDNNVNLRLEDTGCPLTITGVTSQNEGLYVCTTNGTTTSIQLKVDGMYVGMFMCFANSRTCFLVNTCALRTFGV